MAKAMNSDYQGWINRLNAIRSKHGLSGTGLSAPGVGTKMTASAMNKITSVTIGSKWLSAQGALHSNVATGQKITQGLVNEINAKLTSWENTCVHNTVFSAHHPANNLNFSGNCSSNFSRNVFYGNSSNCSDFNFDTDYGCSSDYSNNSTCSGNHGCSGDNSSVSGEGCPVCSSNNYGNCGDNNVNMSGNYNFDDGSYYGSNYSSNYGNYSGYFSSNWSGNNSTNFGFNFSGHKSNNAVS